MKKVKLFEEFEAVGKYNTVKKVIKAIGKRPSEKDVAEFLVNNFKDVTGENLDGYGDDADEKIADIIGFYKFDNEDWQLAWDAANRSKK